MEYTEDVLVQLKDSICIRCKHFDENRFLKDLKKGKLLTDACRKNMSLSTIAVRVVCSAFEPKEDSNKKEMRYVTIGGRDDKRKRDLEQLRVSYRWHKKKARSRKKRQAIGCIKKDLGSGGKRRRVKP